VISPHTTDHEKKLKMVSILQNVSEIDLGFCLLSLQKKPSMEIAFVET